MPATLHASLIARLDRLGPVSKDIAQKGSAIGREFKYELIAAIAGCPEPELREALERLAGSGLLLARGMPPSSTYQFKHALVQDTAYGTLLKTQRQELHRRIASALEERFSAITESQPELLAHHFTAAGLAERAVEYWLRAGQQEMTRSGMAEAIAQLQKGLNVLAGLPDMPWRQQQEFNLLIVLRKALAATKGVSAPGLAEVGHHDFGTY